MATNDAPHLVGKLCTHNHGVECLLYGNLHCPFGLHPLQYTEMRKEKGLQHEEKCPIDNSIEQYYNRLWLYAG